MKPKPQIMDLAVYQPGKPIEEVKREYGLSEVIKMASNENPFGASPKVKEAIASEIVQSAYYPDGACSELRKALSTFYHVDEDQLIFANGSDEIIQFIARVYLDESSSTIMASPSFSMYKLNADAVGAESIEVPLIDGKHDLQAMADQIKNNTKVIWICNPNNPTGTYINEQELTAFLKRVPPEILVVLDEAYYEYVTASDYPQSLDHLSTYSNLLVLRTFSKIYGLAGLRVGYGIGSPKVIDFLNRVREPFNVNRIAQRAACVALEDQAHVEMCRLKNREGMEQYYRKLPEFGFDYIPSHGNFLLVDVKQPADRVFEYLLRNGFIVRSGQSLGYPTSIRVTIGTPEQNDQILNILSELAMKGVS